MTEIQTNRPTDQQQDQQTDMRGHYTFNDNSLLFYFVFYRRTFVLVEPTRRESSWRMWKRSRRKMDCKLTSLAPAPQQRFSFRPSF